MLDIVAAVECPGTCGEWVQGFNEGSPFLVDCPINRFTRGKVRLSGQGGAWRIPEGKTKVQALLELLKKAYGLEAGGTLTLNSELPVGKGMASSTADLVVTAAAVMLAANGQMPRSEWLAELTLQIEPSDSVMFPGIAEMNHLQGGHIRLLGSAVPASFLALDWGGQIDTERFNSQPCLGEHYRRHEGTLRSALHLVREGIALNDLERMAYASTLSARVNLEVNPKPYFHSFLGWVRKQGGLGLITAHSGTILAGVFPIGSVSAEMVSEACERFEPEQSLVLGACDGGVRLSKE